MVEPAKLAEWLRGPHEDVIGALVEDGSLALEIAGYLDHVAPEAVCRRCGAGVVDGGNERLMLPDA